ncbi:hypothetical protein BH18ACI3_BH18ACI3_08120 [soil metagenome]
MSTKGATVIQPAATPQEKHINDDEALTVQS